MKTLYFDCSAGASGDMILGAMVSAGVNPDELRREISLLGLKNYALNFEIVDRSGIGATKARVDIAPEHAHRHLSDILQIIYNSGLSKAIKDRAARIFSLLAEVESRVHNEPVEKIHFHEVGALDAIIDVVGASICFELLQIERFVCSPLHVGSGSVEMDHGRFPVPPPAVAELLKGAPIYSTEISGELVTPTGAAIIASVCTEYGPLPNLTLEKTGYGAGTREYQRFPNVLRVLIGESSGAATQEETLLMLETNIDDMSPQVVAYVLERALDLGALDCYFTPIHMKKNRPGVLFTILCTPEDRETFMQLLFTETTTLGVRSYEVQRRALARELVKVETQYGSIDVKVARLNGHIVKESPEYDQCRKAALNAGVSLREVENAVREARARVVKK